MNSACWSTNFSMSQGHATRSTRGCSRVIHFIGCRLRPVYPPTRSGSIPGSPAAAVDDLRRGALANDLQRRRRPVVRRLVPDGDRPDGRVLRRNAERLAEAGLIEDPEEHRAEPGVDGGLQDEERGHPDVDVPVRHRPPLLVTIDPAFVGEAVARQVVARVREADDDRRRVEHARPAELRASRGCHRRVPVALRLLLSVEDEERPALAEPRRWRALRVRDDPLEHLWIDRPVLERAHHLPLADDILEFHTPTMYEWRSQGASRSSK